LTFAFWTETIQERNSKKNFIDNEFYDRAQESKNTKLTIAKLKTLRERERGHAPFNSRRAQSKGEEGTF
jgi:hypothetical protein